MTASMQKLLAALVDEDASSLERVLGEMCDLATSSEEMCVAFCRSAGVALVIRLLSEAEKTRIKVMIFTLLANVARYPGCAKEVIEYTDVSSICCFVFKNEADTRLLLEVLRFFQTVFTTLPPTTLGSLIVDIMDSHVLPHFVFILQNTLSHDLLVRSLEVFSLLLWTCVRRIQFEGEHIRDVTDKFMPLKDVENLVQCVTDKLVHPKPADRGVEVTWKIVALLIKCLGTVASVDDRWRDIIVKRILPILTLFTVLWPSATRDEELYDMCYYFVALFNSIALAPAFAPHYKVVLENLSKNDELSTQQVLYTCLTSSLIPLLNLSFSVLLPSSRPSARAVQQSNLIMKADEDNARRIVVPVLRKYIDEAHNLDELYQQLDERVASSLKELATINKITSNH